MIRLPGWLLLAGCFLAAPASAQLSLYTVQGGVETPVGSIYDFGPVSVGSASDVVFRLEYTGSATTYYLTYFSLAGTGFSVLQTDWTELPAAVPAAGLNFTVQFQPSVQGSYGGNLQLNQTDGISVILLATGVPGFTVLLNNQTLAAGQTVAFGNVQVGSTETLKLMLSNQTGAALTVPAIPPLTGSAFSLAGAALSGPAVPPGASAELDVTFAPGAAGQQQATLTIGVLSFPLEGVGIAAPPPVLPQPSIQVNLPSAGSAQQGTVSVSLAAAAPVSASGTVTLAFQPSVAAVDDDPSIAFSDGTLSANFTVAQGASSGQFSRGSTASFGTGTTAGTLTFTVTLGSNTAQASVVIPSAVIGIDAAVAARNVGCLPTELYCTAVNVQLQINGWDNTRSASQLVFQFFDQSGNAIAPGNITVDATSAFQQYFAGADLGGVFGLSALFPVTGDADDVVAAQVQFTNSAGTSQTARITF